MTLWEDIYKLFFNLIVKDIDFFIYNDVLESEALQIAQDRAKEYLISSISELTLNCTPEVNFNDYNESLEMFNFDATQIEKDLLSNLMYEQYFKQDMVLLKAVTGFFSPKDLNVFSPANERKTFIDMYNYIVERNEKAMKKYSARDRITGKLKQINYSSYEQ